MFTLRFALEPIVAEAYQKRTGRELIKGYGMEDRTEPWRRGTPDYLQEDSEEVIEIKVFNSFYYNQIKKEQNQADGVPMHIHCQGQWYADLCNYRGVRYLIWNCDEWDYLDIPVSRDDQFCQAMRNQAKNFWYQTRVNDRPASLMAPYLPGDDVDDETFLIPQGNKLWTQALRDYSALKKAHNETKEAYDEAKLTLHRLMSNKTKAVGRGMKVNFKPHMRKKFNSKKFGEEFPSIIQEYTTEFEVRPLLVYGEFEE